MKYTSNYNLKKPDGTDVVNIEDFNGNADIIDTQLKTLKTTVDGKANTSHTHTKSQITDFPASLKNPTSLTVQFNGTTNKTYDGSTAQTVNITPSAIGAAASSHGTHVSYSTDTPKVAGTASAGTAATVARTDHVHPAQTSVSGNAGTATKLATARTINGVSFDGTANITIADNTKVPTSTGNSITIHADSDSSSASEYAVLRAGGNELKVLSSAGGANPIKNNANLFFNGHKVYNAGNKPTKADVGLGNVDNTSDANKPISTAMQNALNGKANSSHTHTKSQITDMPTTMKNPNALTVQFNGVTNKTYDGGTAQTLNITPAAIGASATSHTHDDRYYTESEINSKINTINNNISQLSNPNLLINGDFQVWQRGTSFNGNTGITYTADRWFISGDTAPKVEKIDNGVKITSTKNGTWTNFGTRLESSTLRLLVGKTLTYTVKLKTPTKINQVWSCTTSPNGQTYHHSQSYTDKNYEFLTGSFLVKERSYHADGFLEFGIQGIAQAGNSYEIEWVKLEIGSVATPFVPRPYAEELALCQRYYECSTHVVRGLIGADLLRLSFDVQYKQTKRVPPTLKIYGLNNEEGVVIGKIGTSMNFPVRIYQCTADGFGCIDVVDRKGQNFVPAETFELGGWTLDAEIY